MEKNKWLFLILFVIVQNSSLLGQNYSANIGSYFANLNRVNQFNGNVLIAENDKILYKKSFGFAHFERKIPLAQNSPFPIASITKTFTSTAILQLKQRGKLQLHDPVKNYLPHFPYPDITVQHLLSNTSGLAQYYNLFDSIMLAFPDKLITNSDIIPAFITNNTPLKFTPGERWEYNNVNFCIAALVIETISQLSYAEYIKQNIFIPAGMKNSIVPANRRKMEKNQVERYSFPTLYAIKLENVRNVSENFKIDERNNFYGSGGIVSTSEDLYKFQQALFQDRLIGKKEREEAFTPTKLNDGKLAVYKLYDDEITYGLGWIMYTDEKNGKIVFHDGSLTGLTSILAINITKQQTVILLENTGSSSVLSAANAMVNMLNGKTFNPVTENFARQYGNAVVEGKMEQAQKLFSDYQQNPGKYTLAETEMNRMGYQLMRQNKKEAAVSVFRLTTQVFPDSWNAFDSYGEALLADGQKEAAVKMYKKSIALNPDNDNGKKVLQEITGK